MGLSKKWGIYIYNHIYIYKKKTSILFPQLFVGETAPSVQVPAKVAGTITGQELSHSPTKQKWKLWRSSQQHRIFVEVLAPTPEGKKPHESWD
jgi:hypothetical protein